MTDATPVAKTKDLTPQRLIETASGLLSKKGYSATSVRDITSAAQCNVAAVNYHFGSKQGLYEHIFKEILAQLREQRIAAVGRVLEEAAAQQDIEKVLGAFADAFLEPLMDQERGEVMVQLLMREMADPHLPPTMFVEQMVDPVEEMMVNAMQRTCPGLEPQAAIMCLHSLVAQLVHVLQARKLFAASGRLNREMADRDRAVEHIIRFSAAGVRTYQRTHHDLAR